MQPNSSSVSPSPIQHESISIDLTDNRSHTIVGLSKRLEGLEAALAETQNTVKQLVSESPTGTGATAKLQSSHIWPTPEDNTPVAYEAPVFKRPSGHFLRGHDAEVSERYYGPASLESLLYDMRDLILEPLADSSSENPALKESALLAQHKFDLLLSQEEQTPRSGALPTTPPISILKAMIEPYFAEINPHFPIWSKESFTRHVAALQEAEHPGQDLARVVCSNNLILMALAANSLHPPPHPNKPRQSKAHRNTSTIDLDLTKGFLSNAKRAIEHAELLISPRLVNVQALLSLCVVAQEHMSISAFARLFNLASLCAKSIGLHDWESSARRRSGDEETRERQCVSYCLYVLDKEVCWAVGASPSIPMSDVNINLASSLPHDRSTSDLAMKARLAEIQEEIHKEIYALRAPARSEGQVRLLILKFNQKLQHWLAESSTDVEDTDNSTTPGSASKIEQSLGFACTQLLYLWPFGEHPDAACQRIEVARRCMRLLLYLWRSAVELGYQGVFPRIVASHPPLYLYEISAHLLAEEGQESDAELLQSFTEMLQSITDLREEDSYNRRLCEVSGILTDVITALRTQRKRRKTQHSPPLSLTAPMHTRRTSTYNSPPSDIHATNIETNSPLRAQENSQGTSNFSVTGFEPLLSPADSRAGGGSSGCSDDELATIMGGNLEKGPFESFDLLAYAGPQVSSRGESLAEKEMWWD
ncbi:hypothetical protein AAE478_002118 [Parahypoxylon ruwenzoriense]